MNSIVEDILMHYGMPRRSGRWQKLISRQNMMKSVH